MKAKNGGIGMTDEQVKTFISRCVFPSFPPCFSLPFLLFSFIFAAYSPQLFPLPLPFLPPFPLSLRRSYMPGYELFLRGLSSAPWTGGKGLAVVIGKGREILRTEEL